MWEWWRVRVYPVSLSLFQAFPLALRLVVLVQPSSANIERVFSQLKHALEEVIEARLFVRCNKFSANVNTVFVVS
jgi:hypothetical protein